MSMKDGSYRTDFAAARKKNVTDYFQNFSRVHRVWMQELANRVKERGEFGIHKFMLADYYKSPKDKELALMVSLIVSENGDILQQVGHLRELLGESPTKMYNSRSFVRFGTGRNRDKRIQGCQQPMWKLANVLSRVWDIEHPTVGCHAPTVWKDQTDFESEVLQTMRTTRTDAFSALTYFLSDIGVGQFYWNLNFLALRLFRCDGLGMGLWGRGDEELLCPWNSDMTFFLRTWWPDYRRVGSPEVCVKKFELRDDLDFFYAWLGYKELQKRNPKACSEYATCYQRWYDGGIVKQPYQWRGILPEIVI
jgi:hypothetical protein